MPARSPSSHPQRYASLVENDSRDKAGIGMCRRDVNRGEGGGGGGGGQGARTMKERVV